MFTGSYPGDHAEHLKILDEGQRGAQTFEENVDFVLVIAIANKGPVIAKQSLVTDRNT